MAKRKKTGKTGVKAAPSREEQDKAAAISQQKEKKKAFLKQLKEAERLVVFTGNSSISHFGFNSDGDFLLFLMDQVYGWDGQNPVFQNVLKSIQQQVQEAQEAQVVVPDEVDEIFEEDASKETAVPLAVVEDPDEDDDEEEEEPPADEKKEEADEKKKEANELRARLAALEEEDEE